MKINVKAVVTLTTKKPVSDQEAAEIAFLAKTWFEARQPQYMLWEGNVISIEVFTYLVHSITG